MVDGPCGQDRGRRWASFRLSVIGPLLAAPPRRGKLRHELEALAAKTWKHPLTGDPAQFATATLEQWYYRAKCESKNPIDVLGNKIRDDHGEFPSLSEKLKAAIFDQHRQHRTWSHQLHFDNLSALAESDESFGTMPSYATIRRFRKAHGLVREKRGRNADRAGAQAAVHRLERREVRRFEARFVNGLWHCDFHHGSRRLLGNDGDWITPILFAVLDDRSRLVCHAQWYLNETAENLVHGLSQAILKRGLPRALLSDNGSAMIASDTTQGLERLSIVHETTLPYSPYQNGKQEVFWAQVEGRLMAMLEGCDQIELKLLNEATQAWVEMEYHQRLHSETGQSPIERFLVGPDVTRPSPPMEMLRLAFGTQQTRAVRRSDGTISVANKRFEIPSRYRHFQRVTIRYVSWDLSRVHLVDPRTDKAIAPIYPSDPTKNSDGRRRSLEPVESSATETKQETRMAPLLKKHMEDYREHGIPAAYLPKDENDQEGEDDE